MKKMNKFLSAAAAAVMCFSVIAPVLSASAATAGAENELSDGTFTYELIDGSYTIVDCEDSAIVDEIPAMRNGYAITAIGEEALAGCAYVSELKIPETVKTIGQYAFAGSAISSVELPPRLSEIPDGAFAGCTNLKEVVLTEQIERVGNRAFYNCITLESVTFNEGLASIGDYAFQCCYMLTELDLPSSLEKLGTNSFADCANVKTITAEGNSAFVVEENVLYDKEKTTLYRAASLGVAKSFYVPDTVTAIADGAFSYCTELENIFLSSSVKTMGQYAFNFCTALTSVDLSEGLSQIGPLAFAHCTALTTVSIPTTALTIGEGAFFDCSALNKVIIPEGVTSIETGAFLHCTELKNVIVPSSVSTVGEYAFGFKSSEDGSSYVKYDGFDMSVSSGSAAEKYAKTNELSYSVMDRSIKQIAFIAVGAGLLLAAAVFAVVLMRKGKKLAPADVRKAEAEKAADETEAASYESILAEGEDNKKDE